MVFGMLPGQVAGIQVAGLQVVGFQVFRRSLGRWYRLSSRFRSKWTESTCQI